jgi:hypothetical protein
MSRHRAKIPGNTKLKRKNFTQVNVYGPPQQEQQEQAAFKHPQRALKCVTNASQTVLEDQLSIKVEDSLPKNDEYSERKILRTPPRNITDVSILSDIEHKD